MEDNLSPRRKIFNPMDRMNEKRFYYKVVYYKVAEILNYVVQKVETNQSFS